MRKTLVKKHFAKRFMKLSKFLSPLFVAFVVVVFFYPFFLQGKLPIPSDTIIGLYHPFRDLYAADYPRGIPFKNFLITDPVRQLYPWRELVIDQWKHVNIPIWNPYSMAGYPLLANMQSAAFYPFNILFWIFSVPIAWSLLILLEPLLAGIFLYLYLRHLRVMPEAAFLGAISFSFSGFFIAWFEWGTVLHVALWLPLILLAKEKLLEKRTVFWVSILMFAECSQVFAGHPQILFYSLIVSNIYLFGRIIQLNKEKKNKFLTSSIKMYTPFFLIGICIFVVTSIQTIPAMQFIQQSARDIDQVHWQQTDGWFIPLPQYIQFVAPDYFGNPTTLNYTGVWNYGELVGYIGIIPLVFAVFAIVWRRDKKTLFFSLVLLFSVLFSLDTIIARIPFILNVPFLSTAQPTRLLFITDFSLAVLAALGIDYCIKSATEKGFRRRNLVRLIAVLAPFFFLMAIVFVYTFIAKLTVASHNLFLPITILTVGSFLILTRVVIVQKRYALFLTGVLLCLIIVDLLHFAWKFDPFTNQQYLFPQTKSIAFLRNDTSIFRIMSTNAEIFPPNFSSIYRLETIDGYDPLYLRRYGEFAVAIERNKPDITPPFGFNRIVTIKNASSPFINLMGVKYVFSFDELQASKFEKILEEGKTKIYRNKEAFPRAFFVSNVVQVSSKHEAINRMFEEKDVLQTVAIIEENIPTTAFSQGIATITRYTSGKLTIETKNKREGFLVVTNSFYPSWHARIDNQPAHLVQTDFAFQGLVVPSGDHTITLYTTIW